MSNDIGNKVGRPTIINETVVKILEDALKVGSTVTQACHIAQISRQVFYNHLEENVEFFYRMNTSRSYLQLKALKNVNDAVVKGDLKASMWLLEKYVPQWEIKEQSELYRLEKEVEPEDEEDIDVTEKKAKDILEAIDAIKGRGKYAPRPKEVFNGSHIVQGNEVIGLLHLNETQK